MFFAALRAKAVGEVGFGVAGDLGFQPLPFPLAVTDLVAESADGHPTTPQTGRLLVERTPRPSHAQSPRRMRQQPLELLLVQKRNGTFSHTPANKRACRCLLHRQINYHITTAMHPNRNLFVLHGMSYSGQGSSTAKRKVISFFLIVAVLILAGTGCRSAGRRAEARIPVVKLSQTPAAVRVAIVSAASGARIEKIIPGQLFEQYVYWAFIATPDGSRRVTVNQDGVIVENAAVIPLAELPPAVQEAARTGVPGDLQVCRKSLDYPQPVYLVDYLLKSTGEPVFAIIHADGLIRAVISYAEDD